MSKKSDSVEFIRLFSRISLLTQLGLSVVTPPILSVLLSLWLQDRFGVGDWILLCAILIGIVSGVSGVFSFVRREAQRETRREAHLRAGEKDAPQAADPTKERKGTSDR